MNDCFALLKQVVSWLPAQGKYEVDDIDEEQKNRHILSKRRVVPLPLMRADPRVDEHALFPKGAVVMALYPQTTCFYRAVVNRLPANAADPYEVLFEVNYYIVSKYILFNNECKKNNIIDHVLARINVWRVSIRVLFHTSPYDCSMPSTDDILSCTPFFV